MLETCLTNQSPTATITGSTTSDIWPLIKPISHSHHHRKYNLWHLTSDLTDNWCCLATTNLLHLYCRHIYFSICHQHVFIQTCLLQNYSILPLMLFRLCTKCLPKSYYATKEQCCIFSHHASFGGKVNIFYPEPLKTMQRRLLSWQTINFSRPVSWVTRHHPGYPSTKSAFLFNQ